MIEEVDAAEEIKERRERVQRVHMSEKSTST